MFAYSPDETIYPLLSEKSDFQGPSCWEPSLDHVTPSFDIRLWLVNDINLPRPQSLAITGGSTLYARSHHPSLALLACSRVPQSPLSLGKACGGGRTLTVSYGAYLPKATDRENTAFNFMIENQSVSICLFGKFYLLRLSASRRKP